MMIIRKFWDKDAEQISALIGRNFIEINSKDYPLEEMMGKIIIERKSTTQCTEANEIEY